MACTTVASTKSSLKRSVSAADWAIHGNCGKCGQHSKLGLFIEGEGATGPQFWCFACLDERDQPLEPPSAPAKDTDEEVPSTATSAKAGSLQRSASMKGWAIHGNCDCCSQANKLGRFLEDGKTDGLLFWCFACLDERSDKVQCVPVSANASEGADAPDDKMHAALKRLPTGEVAAVPATSKKAPLKRSVSAADWAIHGNCGKCGQHSKLGLFIDGEGATGPQFWCFACLDERDQPLEPPSAPAKENDEQTQGIPTSAKAGSLQRSASMKGWAIHGNCDSCSQANKLGRFLEDGKTNSLLFWCFACLDERSDKVQCVPVSGKVGEGADAPDDKMHAALKRLPTGEVAAAELDGVPPEKKARVTNDASECKCTEAECESV